MNIYLKPIWTAGGSVLKPIVSPSHNPRGRFNPLKQKIQNYNIKNMINQLNNSTNFSYNQTEELSNKADSIQFNNNINSNPINKMTTEKTPYWTS